MAQLLKITKEIKIDVPWGHIAAKAWGDSKNKPILCIHGTMDNAGTFDRLVPYLPSSFYYICIDLPGHGMSSHFPPHLPIYSLDYIVVCKLLMKHFEQKRYIIIGHSYGGQLGYLFSQIYPHLVEKLVLLEGFYLFPVSTSAFVEYLQECLKGFHSIQEKMQLKKEPVYTYDEALERIMNGRNLTSLSNETAAALLKRGTIQTEEGKYKFTIDQRMKYYINPLSDFRYITETMRKRPVTCPMLVVAGSESSLQQNYMKPIIDVFKEWNHVGFHIVNGGHDVHSDNPEEVAPLISAFLLNAKASL